MAGTVVALGDVKRLDPRTVWAHEEQDFTPWLFAHLGKLGEALGLDLEAEEQEADVGDFAVDIVAKETGTNRVVVIENQLEPTDHRHLGQLLTYAAGKDAGIVVWISPEFRDEHREALDWLNRESGDGRPEFFGVELQVIQIDDSKPAVNLRPVAFPNDWTRDLKQNTQGDLSEKQQRYQEYFQVLLDDLRDQKFSNAKKAQPQSWYSFSAGVSGYALGASFAQGSRLRVDLYIDLQEHAENKAAFQKLLDQKTAIETELGEPLTWEKLEGKRACRVSVYRPGSIFDEPDVLAGHRDWMKKKLVQFKKVFGPRLG